MNSWTRDVVVGSTTADEICHSMADRGKSINYHNDGKGFTRIDQAGNRHSYRDSDNPKKHDHWLNGEKVSKD